MASEQWRTTGHKDSSAHTQDVYMKHKGGSTLRDKALWVTGLVSKVNAYSILTPLPVHPLLLQHPALLHVLSLA